MIQKHCYECGTALTERELEGEGIVPYCPQCQQYRFPMYNVAVSMVVINEQTGQILLIRQYGKPQFILVAGYVNRGEQLEHAVCREVKEETGMTVTHVKDVQLYGIRCRCQRVQSKQGNRLLSMVQPRRCTQKYQGE